MPTGFPGEGTFPGILQSRAIAYEDNTTITKATAIKNGTGDFAFQIGTAASPGASITWQAINENEITTLDNPNKALFYRVAGETGSILNDLRIEYS